MIRKVVECDGMPPAVGPYSNGVWAGNLLFLTGVCGEDPQSGKIVGNGDIRMETKVAMETAKALLKSQGLDFSNVVNSRIYITDFKDFKQMNDVYASYFKIPYPARATVQVSQLANNAHVEIIFVAYKEN